MGARTSAVPTRNRTAVRQKVVVMVEKRRVWLATLMKGGTLGILLIGVLAVGCLTRPVVSQNPTTKTSFATQVKQQSIDKIDLLFAIDNSASMGDKQDLLAAA